MAPEQAEAPRAVDTRADIYSFGATFYHALTGSVPFEGETIYSVLSKHKAETLIAPQARNPTLSERISALLERCLAKSPAERFPSFDDVLKHFLPATSAESPWVEGSDPLLAGYLKQYQLRREVYLNRPAALVTPDLYEFPDGRVFRILCGNIAEQTVDAIVSSDDVSLSGQGGVSLAIREAAGPGFDALKRQFAPARRGRVVVTPSAGTLKSRFVFHGVTISFQEVNTLRPSRDLIIELLNSCAYHADTLHLKSLALPLLGTGVGRLPLDVCLDTMFHFLARSLLRRITPIRDVRLVLYAPPARGFH
jgi:O-acetyl-ADP-ribose deacetylase (regulator of RNase III)